MIVPIGLRLPKSIHTQLVAIATTERRSLNDQMLYLLETGCRAYSSSNLVNRFAEEVRQKRGQSASPAPVKE